MKSKRQFLKNLGLGLSGLFFFNFLSFKKARSNYKPKVVIVGGGVGGASCLRYLSDYTDYIDLSIIEKKKKNSNLSFFKSCNWRNQKLLGYCF